MANMSPNDTGPTFFRENISMLGEGGRWNLFLGNQTDNLYSLAFREMIVNALRTRLNSTLGHIWPLGHSLPTSDLDALLW